MPVSFSNVPSGISRRRWQPASVSRTPSVVMTIIEQLAAVKVSKG